MAPQACSGPTRCCTSRSFGRLGMTWHDMTCSKAWVMPNTALFAECAGYLRFIKRFTVWDVDPGVAHQTTWPERTSTDSNVKWFSKFVVSVLPAILQGDTSEVSQLLRPLPASSHRSSSSRRPRVSCATPLLHACLHPEVALTPGHG